MSVVHQPTGRGVLYVSSTVGDEVAAAFDEWCDTVHHFDTMRIDGFLSLRRFERVAGTAGFDLLTLYQVAEPGDADFSTPAYERHTATYTPAPPGVTDHITFERTVYERVGSAPGPSPVGAAMVTLVGDDGPWLDVDVPGSLACHRLVSGATGALLVDVVDVEGGHAALAALDAAVDRGRYRSLQLFRQVFPAEGVLLRDRRFLR